MGVDAAPVVEVQNLKKTFGAFAAVDGVSFHVHAAECLGLLGPNGAGKTSTIRMLYGYSPPSGGVLRLFGCDWAQNHRAIKQRIGVCQQEDNLDPDLTVLENLLVFARYFDLPRDEAASRAEHLLDFFSLLPRSGARIQELSGGMKRRLVLARALINNPDLLILDEPTTGLDPQSRHQVWQRLEALKAHGLTILLTSHYMEEAARLCDRLIIMDRGRVLVEGTPDELIRRHVGSQVIEVAAPPDGIRQSLIQRHLDFDDLEQRLVVYPGDDSAVFADLSRTFGASGVMLRPASLEDVFLRLTGRELRE